VGERPISEYIVRQLVKAGVKEITFCVNYLGEQVKAHFGNGEKWQANIGYIHENEPLGTIGGIRLKPQFKFEDLLIINGDLLTTIHFDRFFAFFIEEDADIAVATIPYRVNLPYGIFELGPNHEVKSVREKPIFNYYLNTGIYFIKRELTALIPNDRPFDAIDLIDKCLESGRKVASYPLHDYWIDIGQMEDFQKAQEDIHFLDL
jgi:NDP-sugar pyrophosphorylase family protein